MSGPKRGGVAVKVLSGRTAASLQRYRDSKEDKEPPLFMATRHCAMDAETQIAEWKAVRVEHGTQGATRSPRARYETVDPDTGIHASGQRGTHIKHWDGKRHRKRLAGPGETPTHLRIEPEDALPEKESEATHSIYAFGADLVNPENPEDVERAFLAVKAERDEHYPGLQESIWGERNGESGLFHVHVASNATIYRAFELDGVEYRAGQKMGGDMRDVHSVRARFEQYLDAHPEYGLEQSLARVGTPEYAAAQRRDGQHAYWEAERAKREGRAPKETNQDHIRREAYEALQEPGVVDRDSFVAEMKNRGVEVEEILRRGKRGKGYDLRYRVDGTKQAVKGTTLGPEYAHDVIDAQLARKSKGLEVEVPAGQQRVGEPAQLPLTSTSLSAEEPAELEQLKSAVARMAEEERARQQADRREAERDRLAQQIADYEREQQRLVDNPPERFADLSEDELAQLVDETVVVHPGRSSVDDSPVRRAGVGSLSCEMDTGEQRYVVAKWSALDEPVTAAERNEAVEDGVWSRVRSPQAIDTPEPATPRDIDPIPSTPSEPETEPFRSGLRGVKAKGGSEAIQQRIDGVADLEEDYRGALPDAEYERRAKDLGIGPQFLRDYGEHLEPETRRQLEFRARARAAGTTSHDAGVEERGRGTQLREEHDRVQKAAERNDPTGWMHDAEVKRLASEIRSSDRRVDKTSERTVEIRDLVKEGRYEDAAQAAERHQEQDRKSREAMESYSSGTDRDDDDVPSAADMFARAEAAEQEDRDPSLGR